MRLPALLLIILVFQSAAHAGQSSVWWPQWNIKSSEELYDETKYSTYSIPLMLDSNAKTAWIYSAKSKEFDDAVFATRYWSCAIKAKKLIFACRAQLYFGTELNAAAQTC